ncbi:MAG TPA: hypothetical protein VFT74_19055 [Isosphaeraceae bacterium]|nr:hypothetical protein [Isosphaeraceae bacterium]
MSSPTKLPSPVPAPANLADLRKAVSDLGSKSVADVGAVRQAFTSGIPPLQTVGSGSASDYINRFGGKGVSAEIVKSTSQLGVRTAVVGTVVTPPHPELDYVEVGDDRSFGVLDSFYIHLVASLSAEDVSRVAYLRVMRAKNGRLTGVSKPAFSAMIDGSPIGVKTKSTEQISNTAFRADSVGVGNSLTDRVADEPFSKQRAVVSSGSLRPLPPALNTNRRGMTDSALVSVANADRSVLESVSFYVNQRTISPVRARTEPLVVAKRSGINVLQGSTVGGRASVVEQSNAAGFSEVARLSVAGARRVGAFVEVEYWDPSVVHGASYTYYVSAVTKDGIEGPRSRLVKADITVFRPPATPDVFYSVVAGRPRFAVRCSGSFIDHVEVFRKGGIVPEAVRVLSTRAAQVDDSSPISVDSGFYHIGDLGVGVDRSAVYVDQNVLGGQSLEYRFYTVDSFGAKSPTPFSCSLLLPDHGAPVPLPVPSIHAEQAADGKAAVVSVQCDDPRVGWFVIGRRELVSGEHTYRQPSAPDYFTLGVPLSAKRADSRLGPTLSQFSKKAWAGVVPAISGGAVFRDESVEYDRKYQYSAHAIDVRGNRSSQVPAHPILVSAMPVSDPPVGLAGTLTVKDGAPVSVLLTWSGGTSDFSPNDLIGDQDVLNATSQRSVYQVERRAIGGFGWEAMPATTESYFIDPVSAEPAPKFRPSYARVNSQYDYRVIAMQSGAYLSTHTQPVRVAVTPGSDPPAVLFVRSTPTSVRPIQVVVSWQYDGQFVDGWEIERAVTNKVYGSKIFSMDSAEARSLAYAPVARVMRESSKGHGISQRIRLDQKVFVGNRFYADQDVDLSNSYFYRVRSFDPSGRPSDWTYGGIALVDSPFDRKLFSALSDDEKSALTLDPRPISKWRSK